MMGGEGSGMEPEAMEMEMASGDADDNDMMTLPQVMMSMGMEKQADRKCNACAMQCMEEKDEYDDMKGYGEGEYGYGDKPEGSGSGMGMKGDKNMMKKKMCLKKCVQKEKIQMLANSFCDMMKPEGEMGSGMMKPEGEYDDMDDMDGGYGNKGDMDMCMNEGKPEGEYGYDKPEGEEYGDDMGGYRKRRSYGDNKPEGEGEMGHGHNDKKEKHDHCDVCAVSCMTHGKTQVEIEIMDYMMMGNKMDMDGEKWDDMEMGSGMMGSGMMKPEGEMDKPEGEWEKPEGEMSGSGMMGMKKDQKTW